MPKKLNKEIILQILAVFAFLLSAIATYYYIVSPKDIKENTEHKQNNIVSDIDPMIDYSTKKYKYEILENDNKDQELIRQNKETGEISVVFSNIKETILGQKENQSFYFAIYAQPENSSLIFLQKIDSFFEMGYLPILELYSFNTKNEKIIKMEVNKLFSSKQGVDIISRDQEKVCWIPADEQNENKNQKAYIVNLREDNYELIINLSGEETLSPGQYLGVPGPHIFWTEDNHKLLYSVFDQSKKDPNFVFSGNADIEKYLKSIFIREGEYNF